MKRALSLIAVLLFVPSCETPIDPEELKNAEVFFPPRFRYMEDPHFCFTEAERKRALQECKKGGADTLFEFVVDSDGKVKKARVVTTRQPSDHVEDLVTHAKMMTFSADAKTGMYRGFYFPVKYTYRSEFDWINQ